MGRWVDGMELALEWRALSPLRSPLALVSPVPSSRPSPHLAGLFGVPFAFAGLFAGLAPFALRTLGDMWRPMTI